MNGPADGTFDHAGAGHAQPREAGPRDGRAGPKDRPDRLRCDAARNRERVLAAAMEVYRERGPAFTMEEVAARAGVGIGTVYRRFPTKTALLDAIALPFFERMLQQVREAAENSKPAEAAEVLIRLVAEQHAAAGVRTGRLWSGALSHPVRVRIGPEVEKLLEAGRAAGTLRPDLTYEDVSVLLWTLTSLIDATNDTSPNIWRRYLELMLDGIRPNPSHSASQPTSREDWVRLAAGSPILALR